MSITRDISTSVDNPSNLKTRVKQTVAVDQVYLVVEAVNISIIEPRTFVAKVTDESRSILIPFDAADLL